MQILQLSMDFYPKISGGAKEDWEFAKTVVDSGHQITVLTPLIEGSDKRESVKGIEIIRPFRAWSADRHPTSPIGMAMGIKFVVLLTVYLFRMERLRNYDVIYSTNLMVHPIAKLVGGIFQIPVANYIAYSPVIDRTVARFSILTLFERIIYRFCLGNVLICRNPAVRDLATTVSDADVFLVHGILNTELFRNLDMSDIGRVDFLQNPAEVLLVYVGRFVAVKNPVGVVEVMGQLPDRYRLLMIGEGGFREKVEAEIQNRELSDRIELLGERPHEETVKTIAAADALLLTSKTEAYPTVVFEALAVKTDVYSTPVGILPEIDHERLWLSEVDEFCQRLTSREFSRTETTGIDETTLREFSMDRYAQRTLEIIADMKPYHETGRITD